RLSALPWTAPLRLPPLALWDRAASDAGLSLEVDPSLFANLSDEDYLFPSRKGTATVLDALQTLPGEPCVIFDSRRLRVLSRVQALEYWQDWARRQRP